MDKNIESYIDQIVSELTCDETEKREIVDEMKDHLYLLKCEYIKKGLSDKEATKKALECFGEQKHLKSGYQESLIPYYKVFKIGTWILFCLYSFIVLFKLLFQRILIRITDYTNAVAFGDPNPSFNRYFFSPPDSNGFFDIEVWLLNSNIIPFQNTIQYIMGFDRFNMDIIINNTLGNIMIFLPLGIFLPMLFKKYYTFSRIFVSSIIISFSIEVQQFVFQIGQFDIDDIILYTIGCALGYFVIRTIRDFTGLMKKKTLEKSTS
ncbi:VanZ family protein [Bacillus sp. S/N-304-OC-R1]|uniref:VanZ family protein n=1 Tax=Bacillus sp. S/N-304-OC-R1 TaxID=2758034 RepID=UPI001C8DA43E|nr:VanZ family protein [Bacillus sp. S/N-304-OC-R1]MBY0121590.1 VanZ family protein [Bacillus sp. S/N-304-OC-R1]